MKLSDPKFDPNATTLAQAQKFLQEKAVTGAVCPCCRQSVKLQTKDFTPSMAYVLILLHRHFKTSPSWAHVPTYLSEMTKLGSVVKGNDFSKLRFWGLLEEQPHPKKPKAVVPGFYRMTEKGHAFARGEIKVPTSVFLYNDAPRGFSPGDSTIRECLGSEYHYDDLIEGKLGFVV